ncbi:MAG: FKBP-type peptidyl-prolyl cis-trans isomerase [Porticoccaceae bacterium]
MKKVMAGMAVGLAFVLVACQPPSPETAAETAAASNAPDMALESDEQKISYIMGMNVGGQMKSDAFEFNKTSFMAGFDDALSGAEPKLSDEEAAAVVQSFQEKQMAEQQAAMGEVAENNLAEGTAFLEENVGKEGVIRLESGLQYRVISAGTGASPSAEQRVEVHYRGTLLDGTEFDSSYARGNPEQFGVNQVIPGWVEALQLMKEGGKWELFIPAELGYGIGGTGGVIGPNQVLKFDVELLKILADEAGS